MSNALGIDVSAPGTDWDAWKRHGLSFAGVKATERSDYVNPGFAADWEKLARLGLRRLAYHYGDPSREPAPQARHFARTVTDAGLDTETGWHSSDALALDLETLGEAYGRSPVEVSFWGWAFLTELERLMPHHWKFVYCSPSFADLGCCAKLGKWPLWVAHWGVSTPAVPLPWKTWHLWQYAGGEIIDHDMFNGDIPLLQRWF